jgi:hypothetical protein
MSVFTCIWCNMTSMIPGAIRHFEGCQVAVIAALREALSAAKKEAEEAKDSLKFSRSWWATRIRRFEDFFRKPEIPEALSYEFFSILANGTGDIHESPKYAQLLNSAKHRAESAEARLENLRSWNKLNENDLKNVKDERDRYKKALEKWGSHHLSCPGGPTIETCRCGYIKAWESIAKKED